MTADQLRELLQTPASLFLVMLLASIVSMLKQLTDANRNGAKVTFAEYLSHWPETVGTILANVIAFGVLVVVDQLNFASALGVGYGANSVVDLLRNGGRSASLTPRSPSEPKP